MKKTLFIIAAMLVALFTLPACSSDSDYDENDEGTTLTIGEEIASIQKVNDLTNREGLDHVGETFCFHSDEELQAHADYTRIKDKLPESIDWNNKTLVLVKIVSRYGIFSDGYKIKRNGTKYTIELSYKEGFACAYSGAGALIVINKPGITENDITLKTKAVIPDSNN